MSLNQLQTKAESDLAAVSSTDEIAHLRVITKAGGSRKATPAQAANLLTPLLAPLLGIDYSKLEEQIVPGEFALNRNQVRSQVYVRTLVGTTENSIRTILITLPESGTVIDAWGSILQSSNLAPNQPISPTSIIRSSSTHNIYVLWHKPSTFAVTSTITDSAIPAGATYCITLKYVK